MTRLRRRRRGFTLLEIVFAVTIAATALIAMQATISGTILSAGDSINRRWAREAARAKLEEILAGVEPPDGSGAIEDSPEFTWSSRSDTRTIGAGEDGGQEITVVVLELSFPVENSGQGGGQQQQQAEFGEGGRETIRLASVLPTDLAEQ